MSNTKTTKINNKVPPAPLLCKQEQQVAHEITTDLVRLSRELANTIIEDLREPLEDFIISKIFKKLHEEIELDENIN